MYAIIRTGGKQYRVQPGDILRVEKLNQAVGSKVEVSEVVFVGGEKATIGSPYVSGAKVGLVVTQQGKSPKVLVFKKKRRKGFRKLKGHRQLFTEVFVESITTEGKTVKAESKPVLIDAVAIAERKKAFLEKQAAAKKAGEKPVKKTKPVAKKAAAPKKASKKGASKKKAGAKKTVKKTAKKATK